MGSAGLPLLHLQLDLLIRPHTTVGTELLEGQSSVDTSPSRLESQRPRAAQKPCWLRLQAAAAGTSALGAQGAMLASGPALAPDGLVEPGTGFACWLAICVEPGLSQIFVPLSPTHNLTIRQKRPML